MKTRTVQLGEVAKVGAGQGAPQDRNAFSKDGDPFIRAASLEQLCEGGSDSHLERVSDSSAAKHGLRLYAPNTVVFAKSGMSAAKNRVYRLQKPAYVVNHLATVEPNENLDATFLRYWFEHLNPTTLIQDTAYPSISQERIEAVLIPLPSLSEQRRIAGQLERADRLRRTRRYALALSDTFLPAAFREMFGDPARNDKEWPRATVSDLGDVETGNTPPRENPNYYGDAIEWIKSDNITLTQPHPTKAVEGLSEEGIAVATVAEVGSLLVTCIAGSEASIGNVVLTDRRVSFNQQINSVTPHKGVNPWFLYGLFLTAKPLIQRGTTLAMKRMITKGKLEALVLIRPPVSLQERFAGLVARHERLRSVQRESLRQADHLFQTLLHQAFTEGF